MIYTSYFGNMRKLPPGRYYSVARYTPNIPGVYGLTQLSPPEIMLSRYKHGYLKKRDYIVQFREMLDKVEIPAFFRKEGSDIFLLCYEKPDDFCHRRIILQWLEDNGIPAEEWGEQGD